MGEPIFAKQEYDYLVRLIAKQKREINIAIDKNLDYISDEEDDLHLTKLIKESDLLNSIRFKLDNCEDYLILEVEEYE